MKHYERFCLVIIVAILAASIGIWRWSDAIDRIVYDTAHLAFSDNSPDDLVIIAIDEKSLLDLGRWPWVRDTHAALIDYLGQAGVKAIGFDIIFAEPDQQHPESDQRLSEAVERHGNVVFPVVIETLQYQGQMLEVLPFPPLAGLAAGIGHVHVEYDSDGVCRSVFLREGLGAPYWPHLAVVLHQLIHKKPITYGSQDNSHTVQSPTIASVVARDQHRRIPIIGPENSFRRFSYSDVIAGRIPHASLANKTVLIGATAKGLGDQIVTPRGHLSGVELNANVLHALNTQRFIRELPWWMYSAINFIATLLLTYYASRLSPKQFLLFTFVAVSSALLGSTLLLAVGLIWYPPVPIIGAILLFYPLWSWRRIERALRFLKKRLLYMQEKQSTFVEPRGIKPIKDALVFLEKLAIIERSRIDKIETLPKQNTENSAVFVLSDQHYYLTYTPCIYDSSLPSLDIKRWLEEVVTDVTKHGQKQLSTPVELVDRTIQQLDLANQQVEYGRQLFEQSLAKLQDGVLVLGRSGNVQFFNEKAQLFIPDLTLNQSGMACLQSLQLSADLSWEQCLNRLLNTSEAFFYEAKTSDRQYDLICQGRLLNIHGDFCDTLIIALTDISLLKESERARAEALNFVSHDLRSPMVSVLALLDKAKRQQTYRDSDAFIAEIEHYVQKNLAYAESFLRLAKAESVKENVFNYCDMHSVVDNGVAHVLPQAHRKAITIKIQRSADDAWVWGDGELLERALINLLTNGIKYSDPHTQIVVRLELNAGVRESLGSSKSTVDVHIIDQGRGIAAAEQETMFERFTRSHTTREQEGVGLGLYFVQLVCRRHGGSIQLQSSLEHGSTFTMSLPRTVLDITAG